MASWFGKKKAPDGTNIVRHGNIETKLGVTTGAEGFGQAREAAYKRLFGEPVSVSHEVFPLVPHIDVYTFKRSQGNEEVYSLVTGGMSDLEMTLPRKADKDAPRRVELIFYCSEPRDEYISTLRWVAHFPHDSKSWLGHGHTMPNGNPPAPFLGSTALDTLFFLPPIVKKDQTLPTELQLSGEPVHFLWVVPLTTPECDFKLTNGFDAMLNLFQQNRHPYVFDPHRKSYV
jgi:Suppressor of fused protein (SUFU)